jgi:predicted nucleic-acid-binding protein
MIGVDTNVFLRFSLADDARQHAAATALLRGSSETEPVMIDPIVLVEAAWVLRSAYGLDRAAIAERLAIVTMADRLRVLEPDAVDAALEDFRTGTADLAECLVVHLNRARGCTATFTFDKDAARLPGARLLPA